MIRLPLQLFFLIAIINYYAVEGASCRKSLIGRWTCSPCGQGTRCHSCSWCTGHCYRGQGQKTRTTEVIEYGSVEALYKVPFLDMFNDMNALLKTEEISDLTVVDLYKEASNVIREDCTICNNSPDLNNLSIYTDHVYSELKPLIGTQLFKAKAIQKTTETTKRVDKLPDSLKIKVDENSSILVSESIYLRNKRGIYLNIEAAWF